MFAGDMMQYVLYPNEDPLVLFHARGDWLPLCWPSIVHPKSAICSGDKHAVLFASTKRFYLRAYILFQPPFFQ